MEVKILSYTENPFDTLYLACRQCYYDGSILDFNPFSVEYSKKVNRIKEIIKSGHTSVLEHVSFTFGIKNISRSCSHQLVRHRIASYSQQSQRYVEMTKLDLEIPKKIQQVALKEFYEFEKYVQNFYAELKRRGVENEDARAILPNATQTNLVMTINCRSLLNFFSERCCGCAQYEIRSLANEMLSLCKGVLPEVFDNAGPKCFKTGCCPEGPKRTCKIRPLCEN